MPGVPETYGSGTVPGIADTERVLLVKLILAEGGGSGGGGGANQEVFSGNGSPVGVVVPLVSQAIYIQKDSLPVGQVWEWYGGAWQ